MNAKVALVLKVGLFGCPLMLVSGKVEFKLNPCEELTVEPGIAPNPSIIKARFDESELRIGWITSEYDGCPVDGSNRVVLLIA